MSSGDVVIRGRAHLVGDHVNTDLIIPGRYCHLASAAEMAAHCFEDLDPGFVSRFRPGGVIVAGLNFGCGSSREEAPVTLKAAGVACVVARSFARIFFRNCVNIGLPILECPAAVVRVTHGDLLAVDFERGSVTIERTGECHRAVPFPPFMQELIRRGGLMADARARLASGR